MKKRTSNLSRRIVSLLMSIVLTLRLVTPAAFATEVVDDSGTTIVEGGAGTTGTTPSGDAGNGRWRQGQRGQEHRGRQQAR